ncbi:MAG: DUF4097 domain-containing protein [Clostridiales bacterium]|nr:DUF4097 domain-containing protein [Clostridiales bacterium]
MKKATKKWLLIAVSLLTCGLLIFITVMSINQWDFSKISTDKFQTTRHEIDMPFHDILIDADTADIIFAPTEDAFCEVVCYEKTKEKHSVSVDGGTLTIRAENTKKWYEYIGFSFGSPKLTIYLSPLSYTALTIKVSTGDVTLPDNFDFESIDISTSTGNVRVEAEALDSMKISTTTGDIRVENTYTNDLELSVTTGDITVSSVTCQNFTANVSTGKTHLNSIICQTLTSNGNTGDIFMVDVMAVKKMSIERSTGDVEFKRCDSQDITITTDTGDVEGSFLTDKIFTAKTDTGDVELPPTSSGGTCKITTDTGDIEIEINN